MPHTYSITEAQARLPAVVREAEGRTIAITRRNKVVGYVVSPERLEAMLETLEILANPEAMEAIQRTESGELEFRPLSAIDEPD